MADARQGGPGAIKSRANFGPNDSAKGGYSRTPADLPPGMNPGRDNSRPPQADSTDDNYSPEQLERNGLLLQAQQIFNASTDYLNTNVSNIWERNLAHFHNEHGPGTHYHKTGFKRSRTFRPLTRANVKAQESSCAVAVFSTQDMVAIEPQNPSDEIAAHAAKVIKYLLEWRLENKMPWFQTVMGAYQDTKVHGICISHQYWDYHEDTELVSAFGPNGEELFNEEGKRLGEPRTRIRRDRLACDLLPPENFRFDPSCDWRDPCGTSPYLIWIDPMAACDALEMMQKTDPKTGQPVWERHTLGEILSTRSDSYERTRQAREGKSRIDPKQQSSDAGNKYSTVWAHLNIIRVNGDDIAYWTMGTQLLLTKPKLLREMYPHLREGERPFVVGTSTIEAHRNYPAGDVEQVSGLQEELNTVVNQRLDNVKLVLNKRYHVRRGSQVDLDALIRNVPGGGVMMNDPEKDVKIVSTDDVTGSSYQEQDRLSVEADSLVGSMSQASVMNNRKLNETVGGMSMMGQNANSVQDYGIRIFLTTWMMPVLRQLIRLIQRYETDQVQMALATKNARVPDEVQLNSKQMDDLMLEELVVNVNVGMGNTDPVRRVERLAFGLEKVAALPGIMQRMKTESVAHEIFGSLGFRDGSQFMRNDQEQAQFMEENPQEPPPEFQLKMRELDVRENDNQMRNEREMYKIGEEIQLRYADLAFKYDKSIDEVVAKMEGDKMRDKTMRDIAAMNASQKREEMQLRRQTGAGI